MGNLLLYEPHVTAVSAASRQVVHEVCPGHVTTSSVLFLCSYYKVPGNCSNNWHRFSLWVRSVIFGTCQSCCVPCQWVAVVQ